MGAGALMARRKTPRPKTPRAPPAPRQPERLFHVEAVMVVVACGLLWRRPEIGLPAAMAKYGGSLLWGAMVFFCVAGLKPRVDLRLVAVCAAVVATLVEFSQLIHVSWLDAFRRTTIGALLIGRTFSWWDIAAYWAGIALVCIAVSIWFKRRADRARRVVS